MKIVADENIPYVKEAFKTFGKVQTCVGRSLSADQVKDADILLVRSVSKVNRQLLQGSKVKFVASATIGFDHIDLDYLQQNNIGFARAPASNAVSAAEYVLAAIAWWSRYRQKDWQQLSVGIIGHGNVGSRVHQRCQAVGMKCVINDPPLEEQGEKGLASLEEALNCDVISLHVPMIKDGKHPTLRLLDASNMKNIRSGSLLINAARGYTVDEAVLEQRKDIDLILDCWQDEPRINQHLLAQTLLGTAHIAGYSLDGKIRGTEMIYQACCKFFAKEPEWSATSVDYEPVAAIKAEADIRNIILQAYDITADSKRLKALLDNNLDAASYFDSLRKNYPVRREFSAHQIEAQNLSEQQKKVLIALGFFINKGLPLKS